MPDCFKCKHFHITWDPRRPRGCKVYGFKTAKVPSIIVVETSGKECQMFEPKRQKGEEVIDLNDKKYW